MAERGHYCSIARALIRSSRFRQLTPDARWTFVVLKMNASITGLDVCYPSTLASRLKEETGLQENEIVTALDLLEREKWIRREGDVLWVLGHLEYEPHVKHESAKVRQGVQRLVGGLERLEIVRDFIAAHPDFFPAPECVKPGLSWALSSRPKRGKLSGATNRTGDGPDRGIGRGIEGVVYETETRYEDDPDSDSDVSPSGDSRAVGVGTIRLPAPPDSPASNWVAVGAEWWQANVGHITEGQFGKLLKPVTDLRGWDATLAGMKEWTDERRRLNKDMNLKWFVGDSARWIEQAAMPLTDGQGDLTLRGKRVAGISS